MRRAVRLARRLLVPALAAGGADSQAELRETPLCVTADSPLAVALAQLAFRCGVCGAASLPPGSVQRITVRHTPLKRFDAGGTAGSAVGTGVFAHAAAHVVPAGVTTAFAPHSTNFAEPAYARDLTCAGCGAYLGYRLETAAGAPIVGTDGRPPYKLWARCEEVPPPAGGGARPVLHAAKCAAGATPMVVTSADAWARVAALLPSSEGAPAVGEPPPDAVERTAKLQRQPHAADKVAPFVRAALLRAVDACEAGGCLVRTLAPDDVDPHHRGLVARDPSARRVSPALHVRGERLTPFISTTTDLSVALPWALPYGEAAVVVPAWAEHTGSVIIPPESVLASLRRTDGLPLEQSGARPDVASFADTRAFLTTRVEASREALVASGVDATSVEMLRSQVTRVAAGPTFGAAPPRDGGAPARTAASYPATAADFCALVRVDIPGDAREEFDGRTPHEYFSRRATLALARAGERTPSFLLVRMTPNTLPRRLLDDCDRVDERLGKVQAQLARLDRVLAAGGAQLRAAQADCADAAYYELDVKLTQQRVVFPSLNAATVGRVGVLLIPWSPNAVAGAVRAQRGKERFENGAQAT